MVLFVFTLFVIFEILSILLLAMSGVNKYVNTDDKVVLET